jgi:hypothetical protein
MSKALGSIPSTEKKEGRKGGNKEGREGGREEEREEGRKERRKEGREGVIFSQNKEVYPKVHNRCRNLAY